MTSRICRAVLIGLFSVVLVPGTVVADPGKDAGWTSALDTGSTVSLAELLDSGADPNQSAAHGKTALMVASQKQDLGLVEKLVAAGADINASNDNGGTALMYAAMGNDRAVTDALIRFGADVNARARLGWTALLVAAVKGHAGPARALLDNGAAINATDAYRWTPLMRAVRGEHVAVVEVLLSAEGIDVNAVQESGASALHLAALVGNVRLADLLLAHGADPERRDGAGRTAGDVASAAGFSDLAARIALSGNRPQMTGAESS